MEYLNRIVDSELDAKISYIGAVLIKGPKWCGKTTTARERSNSVLEMQNPKTKKMVLEMASSNPLELLKGDKPRLIDEWQICPDLWDTIRYDIDSSNGSNKYILTGSTVIPKDKIMHSGVGRFAFIDMKTLTLFESGDSTGEVSLNDVIKGNRDIFGATSDMTFDKLAELICVGGWPGSINYALKDRLSVPRDYLELLCDSDISSFDNVKRNASLTRFILRSYARQVSTIDSDKALFDDIFSNFPNTTEKTIREYLNILSALFIIEEIPAWNPNIRSKEAIRKSPKKSFVDPSLAVAALGISKDILKDDLRTFGLLFENLVSRDISVYVKKHKGVISHYRDRYGLECDNIVHYEDGTYAFIEVKLGTSGIEDAERNLLKLRDEIKDKTKMDAPVALIVITGFGDAYVRDSGVVVLPIGCLKD